MATTRRRILQMAGALAAGTALPAWAVELVPTPEQMTGPFYPLSFPLDRDNDLARVQGREGVAYGEIVNIGGRILDASGSPRAGVRIEIWQVNGYGRYHHEGDDSDKPLDPNFQGYGTALSDGDGVYRFRTVKPLAYPGRAPHVHFALTHRDFGTFTTQMYVAGSPENERDFLLSRIRDRKARDSLIVSFARVQGTEPVGEFNIVLAGDGRLQRGSRPSGFRQARLVL